MLRIRGPDLESWPIYNSSVVWYFHSGQTSTKNATMLRACQHALTCNFIVSQLQLLLSLTMLKFVRQSIVRKLWDNDWCSVVPALVCMLLMLLCFQQWKHVQLLLWNTDDKWATFDRNTSGQNFTCLRSSLFRMNSSKPLALHTSRPLVWWQKCSYFGPLNETFLHGDYAESLLVTA